MPFFFFDFPALSMAIATACFCGLPLLTNSAIFSLITFLDLPFLRGRLTTSHLLNLLLLLYHALQLAHDLLFHFRRELF